MPAQNKVRLSDIAKELHVSTVTVSKAIADKEGVSDELRERIKQTACEMGYRFKSEKRNSRGKTGNIGVLIPARFIGKDASFYWVLYNEISKALLQFDYYCVMEILTLEDETAHSVPRMISDKKVDGVIILGQVSRDYAEFFYKQYSIFLFMDFYSGHVNCDSVTSDNFYSTYLLTNYLLENGHSKIAFVGTFKSTSSIQDRYMGYLKAMMENDYIVPQDYIIEDRDKNGMNINLQLPKEMPTAFVCNCDETAYKLMQVLQDQGLSVPKDVSVVGFDNYHQAISSINIGVTTVEVDTIAMARTAVEIIMHKIDGDVYNKGRNTICGKIIIKESVRDISKKD